jgi:Tol biopolymer transport system component
VGGGGEAAYLPTSKGGPSPRRGRSLSAATGRGDESGPGDLPDGTQVAFLSERDLFSIDVFLADAATGKVKKKLVNSATTSHFDALRFIDTAGSWSPDGKQMVLVVFAHGNNELVYVNTESGRLGKRVRLRDVGDIANPAWSPDGRTIAFSGTKEGRSDLYLMDVKSGETTRLTDDRYADLQPTWSADGKSWPS